MPEVDEGQQSRETYGPSPGWSDQNAGVGSGAPPATPEPPAQPDSPPADAPAAPSAEVVEEAPSEEQVSEQATPPPSQPEPAKPWNMPPEQRWEELRKERDEARRSVQELAMRPAPPPPQPAQPQTDPWEPFVNHADPAVAQQYRGLQQLMRHERQIAKQEAVQEMQPVIDAGRLELARLNSERFREKNPEVKPGSEEERLIVAYMSGQVDGVQHPIESAKRNALYDKLETENRALKSKHAATPQKRAAANVQAGSGIPQTAGLPGRPGSWQDRAGAIVDKGGNMLDVAREIFGGRRR